MRATVLGGEARIATSTRSTAVGNDPDRMAKHDVPYTHYRGAGRVLVADDEPSVARLTGLILGQCGFDVTVAASGKEALATIDANRSSLRLVLLDYNMPDFDGPAVLAAARERGCSVPMILSTGYPTDQEMGGLEGFAALLHKPYRFETLVDVLRTVLNE